MQLIPTIRAEAPTTVEAVSIQHLLRYSKVIHKPNYFDIYSALTNYELVPYVLLGMRNTLKELNLNLVDAHLVVPKSHRQGQTHYRTPNELFETVYRLYDGNKLPPTFESIVLVKKMLDTLMGGRKLPVFNYPDELLNYFEIPNYGPILNSNEFDILYMAYPIDSLNFVHQNKTVWLMFDSLDAVRKCDKLSMSEDAESDSHNEVVEDAESDSHVPRLTNPSVTINTSDYGHIVLKLHGQWLVTLVDEITIYSERIFKPTKRKRQPTHKIDVVLDNDVDIVECVKSERLIRFPAKRAVGLIDTRPAVVRLLCLLKHEMFD